MRGWMLAAMVATAAFQRSTALDVRTTARVLQPGELVVLTIGTTVPIDRIHVRAFDREVPVFRANAETVEALIGIDLDAAVGNHTVSIQAGAERVTHVLRVLAHAFPTRKLSVDEAFVNPPASVQPRIAADAELLNQTWAHSAPERLWQGAFARPVPQANNSAFGTRSVYNGQPRSAHGGADFLSPAGTPVAAPNAGKVVIARDLYYTGNTVVIDHGLGLFSLFAHLSRIDAHEGDAIATGTVVGLVGATGRVTGPHLHWTVRVGSARVDPMSVLAIIR
jgi:murein DD-endopeptidase MepM/ murein hydrolase activator NlpD